jgi:hypothetical protein
MSSTFWTNTIWFLLLVLSTIIILLFVIIKAKRRKLSLAFYFTLAGIVLSFETIILIFLKAYAYYPKILHNPPLPFDDILAGNLFSQFSVAATVLLVTVLNLNYHWYFIFAGIYGIIEKLFLALGIYSHNWYRTWMTVLLMPLAFWVANKMYEKITQGIKPIFYYGYIYLGLFPLFIVIINWGLMLLRLQDFSLSLLPDPIMSRHFLVIVHFIVLANAMMLIYFLRQKRICKSLVIIALYIIYYVGYKLNLVIIKDGWFLLVSSLSIFGMYLSVFIMDKLYGGPHKKPE